MINPSSDAIFDVGRSAPETEAEWTAVRNAAIILAESSNLLMLKGRAADNGPWMEMSREMLNAAAMALSAAETEDLDGVMEAGGRIVEMCEVCHEPYRDGGRKMGRQPLQPRCVRSPSFSRGFLAGCPWVATACLTGVCQDQNLRARAAASLWLR